MNAPVSFDHLREWIGRREVAEDLVSPGPLARLAATLDHDGSHWPPDELPPLGHWLFFLPSALQREIATDGHPQRGGFLPPVSLPHRMWAGGSMHFLAPIRVGSRIRRTSTIADVTHKSGRTGELVFVNVLHEVFSGSALAVREEQNLVYRDVPKGDAPARGGGEGPHIPAAAHWQRTVQPDPVLLFRFSALTFNGHRVHYDRDYCRDVEGYPGLVVHAPLTAMLLMDLFLRHNEDVRVMKIEYRAHRPLFDTAPFTVNAAREGKRASLWAANDAGDVVLTAELERA